MMSELDAYDYTLPEELIAQHPLPRRSDARLMLVDRGRQSIEHYHIRDLPELLERGDCLVTNDTRVLPARLLGTRQRTGGRWEGLFLSADGQGHWRLLCKTRGKLEEGETIVLCDRQAREALELVLLVRLDGGEWAAAPRTEAPVEEVLQRVGRVPLPHYIRHGEMEAADVTDYQSVFARRPGAVAAPTASLHFTAPLLAQLAERGVTRTELTLHVGLGTFRPIAAERLADHKMHCEWGEITADAAAMINATRSAGRRAVAVGTTSVRVLETAALAGSLAEWRGETDLFIRPPYRFRAVDALLTNFHLPRSTLLVLVRTFGGDELIRAAYAAAVAEEYRFFSYGDAMLIV